MLFDTHAHLADERFEGDREAVIARFLEAGGAYAVTVADGARNPETDFALAERYPFLYAAVGVHPHDAKLYTEEIENRLIRDLSRDKVVALGEIGLDYYYDTSPRETQRAVFIRQLEIAHETGKPVILHIRDAHGDALEILRAQGKNLPRGVLHCYSGSRESAAEYMQMGMDISFTGSVTFKNAAKLREVAKSLPLGRIMVETDCPYMAPEPRRGRRNEPAYVEHVARLLAELRGEDYEAFCRATTENGLRLFGIGGNAP